MGYDWELDVGICSRILYLGEHGRTMEKKLSKEEEIIEKALKEFGYLAKPRINILFAKKVIEVAQDNFIEELEKLIVDIERHWYNVLNPKGNILFALKKLQKSIKHDRTRSTK